jgi:hypothetical protein
MRLRIAGATMLLLAGLFRPIAAQGGTRLALHAVFWADTIVGAIKRGDIPNEYLDVTMARGTIHVIGVSSDSVSWNLVPRSWDVHFEGDTGPARSLGRPATPGYIHAAASVDRYTLDVGAKPPGRTPLQPEELWLRIPRDLKLLHVNVRGTGNVVVDNYSGELTVTADSGDIVGTNLSGSTILEAREGGVELDLSATPFQQGPVHLLSHDGSITVFLTAQPSADLDLTVSCGTIASEFPLRDNGKPVWLGISKSLGEVPAECQARPKTLPPLPGLSSVFVHAHAHAALGSGEMTLRAMALQGDIHLKTKVPPAGSCVELPDLGKNADGSPVLATIVGRVLGPGGKTLLVGAHMRIQGTQFSTVSDRNGEYHLDFDPHILARCAMHVIVVEAPGYTTNTLPLQIGPKAHSDDVTLSSAAVAWQTLAPVSAARPEEGGRPALASDSVPRSITEAEYQGARYPVVGVSNNPRRSWDSLAGGTKERRCVDVDKVSMAQSGDFIAGPFASYNQNWRTGYGKLIWQPLLVPSPHAPLTVRAAHIDPSGETRVFDGLSITGNGTGTLFYPTGVHLPTSGRWLMVATAGNNWGCFVITVR